MISKSFIHSQAICFSAFIDVATEKKKPFVKRTRSFFFFEDLERKKEIFIIFKVFKMVFYIWNISFERNIIHLSKEKYSSVSRALRTNWRKSSFSTVLENTLRNVLWFNTFQVIWNGKISILLPSHFYFYFYFQHGITGDRQVYHESL